MHVPSVFIIFKKIVTVHLFGALSDAIQNANISANYYSPTIPLNLHLVYKIIFQEAEKTILSGLYAFPLPPGFLVDHLDYLLCHFKIFCFIAFFKILCFFHFFLITISVFSRAYKELLNPWIISYGLLRVKCATIESSARTRELKVFFLGSS